MKHMLALCGLAAIAFLSSCERMEDDDNISAQDKVFVNQMAIANRTEIILNNLALAKSTDDSIQDFAKMLVNAYTAAEANLKTAAGNLGLAITADSLNATGTAMRNLLSSFKDTAFDSAYIYGQVAWLGKADTIARSEIAGGTNRLLRNLAAALSATIQQHLDSANTIALKY